MNSNPDVFLPFIFLIFSVLPITLAQRWLDTFNWRQVSTTKSQFRISYNHVCVKKLDNSMLDVKWSSFLVQSLVIKKFVNLNQGISNAFHPRPLQLETIWNRDQVSDNNSKLVGCHSIFKVALCAELFLYRKSMCLCLHVSIYRKAGQTNWLGQTRKKWAKLRINR